MVDLVAAAAGVLSVHLMLVIARSQFFVAWRWGGHVRDRPSTTGNLLLATPALPDAHTLPLHGVLAAERACVLLSSSQRHCPDFPLR